MAGGPYWICKSSGWVVVPLFYLEQYFLRWAKTHTHKYLWIFNVAGSQIIIKRPQLQKVENTDLS